jgi:hypothetical protein
MWGIFLPKKEDVVGGWEKLHNEELHNLYASTNRCGWDDNIRMNIRKIG